MCCFNCNVYRRIETFPNIYNDPLNITDTEMKCIQSRRKQEGKDFQDFLKQSSEFFYVIDLEWFFQWKAFVMNDLTEKNLPNNKKRISTNKLIGVLPPGPISNTNLFEKNYKELSEKTLKRGLKKVNLILEFLNKVLKYKKIEDNLFNY